MSLDMDQQLKLERILEAAEEFQSRLSEWEASFVSDQQDRYSEYGAGMSISAKQWGVLERIENKLGI